MTTEINPEAKTPPRSAAATATPQGTAILMTIIVVVAIAWLLYWLLYARWHEDTNDAYVQGQRGHGDATGGRHRGRHRGRRRHEGRSRPGTGALRPYLILDVAYQQAVANLANTVRQVRGLYKAVDAGRGRHRPRVVVALEQARADVARRSNLVASGAVSTEEAAHAKAQLAAPKPHHRRNHRAQPRPGRQQHARGQPQVQAATAIRQPTSPRNAQIVAPVSGYIAKRNVQLGQRIARARR